MLKSLHNIFYVGKMNINIDALLFTYVLKHSNVHNSTHNEPESCINALARIIRPEVHKRPWTLLCFDIFITCSDTSFIGHN